MRKSSTRLLEIALGVARPICSGLGVLVVVCMLIYVWRQRGEVDLVLDLRFAGLALVGAVSGNLLFASAWHDLMSRDRAAGSWAHDVLAWCASLPGKYVPGRVWQGLARGERYQSNGKSVRALLQFLREQLSAIAIASGIVGAGSLVKPVLQAQVGPAWMYLTVAAVMLGLCYWSPSRHKALAGSAMATTAESSTMTVSRVVLWQASGYLALCLAFQCLNHAIGRYDVDFVSLSVALCFSGIAGIVAFLVPAGLGARELGLVWALTPLIGVDDSIVLALSGRFLLTLADALCAAAAFIHPLARGRAEG